MNIDRDLQSIQEVRDLVAKAKEAEKTLCTFPQEKLDAICASIASACMEHAEELAKMAVQETGFGKWEDKVLKNKLGSAITWESVKNMKTVGVLRENEETKVTEIGVPMGVVAALIPSTNPTSTVMYKSIISIKAGNAIVISPHPGNQPWSCPSVKNDFHSKNIQSSGTLCNRHFLTKKSHGKRI